DEALDVEEEILAAAVVFRLPHLLDRHRIQRLANPPRVRSGDDALRREHRKMRVVNGHQRREEQLLCVLEVFVEHVGHVLGSKRHRSKYSSKMRTLAAAALAVATGMLAASHASAQSGPNDARARAIYKELIEINTTDSVGNITKAAEAVAARFRAAGFADA